MRMSPAVTSSRPAIIRNVVVFPHPLGPTRMTNSWSRTVRSMPATARVSPNLFSTRSRRTSAMILLHTPLSFCSASSIAWRGFFPLHTSASIVGMMNFAYMLVAVLVIGPG